MIEAKDASHSIIHRDEFAYCAHPHAAVAADGSWLVVFNRAPKRRFVLHPPEDPLFHNVLIRSNDQGSSWSTPQVVPGYNFSGTECAGLTVLKNGSVLLNQWRFDWYPLDLARGFSDQSSLTYPDTLMKGLLTSPEHEVSHLAHVPSEELAPWVRGGGQTFVHVSNDNGASFATNVRIDTAPYSGGYGMRSAAVLPQGTIVLLLSDVPNYRQVFAVRSNDGGFSWSIPVQVAGGAGHEFEEPAVAVCKSGKLIAVLRDNATRMLHQAESADDGKNWSSPRRLDITGYPADLLVLADGRLLMTYGWRQPDFGIRAVLSHDEGGTWNGSEAIRIRGGLPNKNLGYPSTINVSSMWFVTFYYGEDATGCTCIMSTRWQL